MSITIGIFTGLALGSIYMLISLSLTLVLAASGVFNLAQGVIVMIGTILAYVLAVHLEWPFLLGVTVTGLVGTALGFATYLIAIRPTMGRSLQFTQTTLLTTIGMATALSAVVAIFFGGDARRVPPFVSDDPVFFLNVPLRQTYLLMIAVGVIATVAIEWTLRRTAIGHVFRATLEDADGASLSGIDTRKVIAIAFAIAGGLARLAGYLIAPVTAASAFAAQEMAFYGFAGMAIGGFGSFAGALVGGLVVDLLAGVVPTLVDPHLTIPIIWGVVILVLIVKPAGLFGTAGLFGAAQMREV